MHPAPSWTDEFAAETWQEHRSTARRHLFISSLGLMLGLGIWMTWSVLVLWLPRVGFHLSTTELFGLTAMPALTAALLRFFYAIAASRMGARHMLQISTLALIFPAIGISFISQRPDLPYEDLLAVAALTGLGGACFTSVMTSTSRQYPLSRQGRALGWTAGLGHLGIVLVQAFLPWVLLHPVLGVFSGPASSARPHLWIQNAGLIWLPGIFIVVVLAELGLRDQVQARVTRPILRATFARFDNFLLSWLYLGSLGSLIGFASVEALLTHTLFKNAHISTTYLGPLAAVIAIPVGGVLADRGRRGAPLAVLMFILTMIAVGGLFISLPVADLDGSLPLYVACFIFIFSSTGIAQGATLQMMAQVSEEQAPGHGSETLAVLLGLGGAIATVGGFFIPGMLASSMSMFNGTELALFGFELFYASCLVIAWWFWRLRDLQASH